MKNNDKISMVIGLASLSLLAYNTHLNRKQSQLSGALGNIPLSPSETSSAVSSVSSVADTYVQRTFSAFQALKNNPEVQNTLKDLGIDVAVKDITLERTKNILSAYALFKIMTSLKSNGLKLAIVGGGIYALNKNKEKISMAYNELLGDNTVS